MKEKLCDLHHTRGTTSLPLAWCMARPTGFVTLQKTTGDHPKGETARLTGFEPAVSVVTGRRFNQLSYSRIFIFLPKRTCKARLNILNFLGKKRLRETLLYIR